MVSPVEVDGSITLLLVVIGGLVTGAENKNPIRDRERMRNILSTC